MLSLFKRGKTYYIRGTFVKNGKTINVYESTRISDKREAEEYLDKYKQFNLNSKTLHQAIKLYVVRKKPRPSEYQFINKISKLPNCNINNIKNVWNEFCEDMNVSVSTINRYANCLNAVISFAEQEWDETYPRIKKQQVNNTIVFHLDKDTREKLLSCYSKHSKPIFEFMSLQGLRTQECLQLTWKCVDLESETIVLKKTKNGKNRVVPLHKRSIEIILNQPKINEYVFNNRLGKPYTDTRLTGVGGNPLKRSHENALKKLKKDYGISLKMRIHDWRHDFATRLVEKDVDLITIKEIGGWSSLSMVERYATFSMKRKKEAISKI